MHLPQPLFPDPRGHELQAPRAVQAVDGGVKDAASADGGLFSHHVYCGVPVIQCDVVVIERP